jgi:hypothetical protein
LPFCIAASGGNDSNSGQFINQPKADAMSCFDALPSIGGNIYLMDTGSGGLVWDKASNPSTCGAWIGGSEDPNYASFGSGSYQCWRKAKGEVNFIGVAGSNGKNWVVD